MTWVVLDVNKVCYTHFQFKETVNDGLVFLYVSVCANLDYGSICA